MRKSHSLIITLFFSLICLLTEAQTITSVTTNATNYCGGNTMIVNIVRSANFNASNVFTVQLSGPTGSFATPTVLGTLNSTSANSLSVTIPTGIAAGTAYRVRVQTSSPSTTSPINGADITLNPLVTPTLSIATSAAGTVCPSSLVTFTATATSTGTSPVYQWRVNGTNVGTNSAAYSSSSLANGNTVQCVLTSNAVCASTTSINSNTITMSVGDAVAPTITCPTTQNINMNSACSATMPDYRSMVTVSDNCTATGAIVVTQNPAPGSTITGNGLQAVTMTATDLSGNTANCSFNINKVDVTPPTINCPANITVNADPGVCGAIVNYHVTGTDNCMSGVCAGGAITGYTYLGTWNNHTYYRSNNSLLWPAANTAAQSLGGHLATITSAAENAFLAGAGQCWIGLTDQVTEGTWLWVTGEPLIYTNWNPGEPNNSGAGGEQYAVVNWGGAGWNDYGNATNGTLPFILEFDCVSLNMISGAASGSLFPVGTTVVRYTATDMSGNTSQPCQFTVTVTDNTAPVVACPSNITVNAPAGSCSAVVNYTTPTATDNCGNCISPGSIPGFMLLGTYGGRAYYVSGANYTWTAANSLAISNGGFLASVNSAAENTFIRNAATTAGINTYWIGLNDELVEGTFVWTTGEAVSYTNWNAGEPNNAGNEDYTQVYPNGLWNDAGSGVSIPFILERTCITPVLTSGLASGSSFPVGLNTVTYRATDASGNVGTCSFTVRVNDVTPPTIVCPAAQTLNLTAACSAVLPNYTSLATATDNCSGTITFTQNPAPGTVLNIAGPTMVTITATDNAGNAASCTFTVNVADVTAPVIACPANITVNSASGTCGSVVNYTINASDNCATGNCGGNPIAGYTYIGTFNNHTYYRSNSAALWTAANSAAQALGGHLATISSAAESAFLSGIGPHWIGFTDQAVEGTWVWVTGEPVVYTNWAPGEPNNSGGAQNYAVINWNGNMWDDQGSLTSGVNTFIVEFDCVNLNLTAGLPSGSVFPVGTTTVTYTASDAAGNTSAPCSFTVTVIDNQAPTIVCPSNITVNAPLGSCAATVTYTTPVASDNCSNCLVAPNITGFTSLGIWSGKAYYISNTTNTWLNANNIATNNGGYLASITSAAENNFIRNSVSASISSFWIGYTDQAVEGTFVWTSGEPTTYTNWNAGEPNNSGNEDYVQMLSNGFWNDLNGTQNLNFVIEIPCITPTLTSGLASGASFPVGTNTVTWTATDASGNSTSCSFQVIVNDVTPPVVTCPGNQTIAVGGSCRASVPDYRSMATATDCAPSSSLVFAQTPAPGTFISARTIVRITATDPSGNVGSCTFNVNPVDQTAPSITCPANITVSAGAACSAPVTYNVTASDNCSGCAPLTLTGYTLIGTFGGHTYFRSNTATTWINANNAATAAGGHLATVESSAENTYLAGQGICWIGFTDAANPGTWTWVNNEPVLFTNWAAGQPNLTAGNDYVIINSTGSQWATSANTVNRLAILEFDCLNTAVVPVRTAGLASGSSFPVGTTTVTHTATDGVGLTSTCSFTVTVTENVAPTITCPANITTNVSAGTCSATLTPANPTTGDNCSVARLTWAMTGATTGNSPATGINNLGTQTFNVGVTTVTYTVADASNNTTTCSFTVTVTDNINPTIVCPANQTLPLNASCSATLPDYRNMAVVSDNCTSASAIVINQSPAAGTLVSGSGPLTITLTARDASSNMSTCSFQVNKVDQTPPTISCLSNQLIALNNLCSATLPDYRSGATVADNCTATGAIVRTQTPAPGTIYSGSQNITVTIVATDASGNSSHCTFIAQITDNTAPTLTPPAAQNLLLNASCSALLPDYTSLVAKSDNCTASGSLVLSQSPAAGTPVSGAGSMNVTVSTTDAAGNVGTCTIVVNKVDNTPPTLNCLGNQTMTLNNSCTGIVPNYTSMVTATDNCSTVTLTQSPAAGSTFTGTAPIVVTITARDGSNNTSTCSFNLTPSLMAGVTANATTSTTICAGSSLTFMANPTNGGTPTYQ